MQFYDAIITNEGVRMLTAASFANKLTFTRLLFCADNVTLGVTTQSLEHSWGNGHIDNYATADDGSFVIYGSASNAQDYGMAYGFAVYGYLNSEGAENEHIVFVANADGVPTYVNSQSGAATRFQFAIRAKINLSDQVIRIDPNYNGLVSNLAFQDLLERTVTMHSATDAQVGDDQTVRGHKEFTDGIGVWDSTNGWGIEITNYENNEGKAAVLLRTTNGAYYGSTIELVPKTAENQSYTKNDVKFNANLIPYDDGLSVGSVEHRWLEINALYIWASDTIGVSNQYASTRVMAGTVEFLNENDDNIGTIGIQNDTTFRIDGNGNPVYITSLTVDGGLNVTGSFNIATLNAASATIGNVSSTSISTQEVDATGIRTTSLNAASVTSNSATIGNISTTTATAQEVGAAAAEISSLITTNATISALAIGGISFNQDFAHPALIENDTEDAITEIPVGSIFLAYVVVDAGAMDNIKAGGITNTITSIRTIRLVPLLDSVRGVRYMTIQYGSEFQPNGGMDFQILNNTPRSGGIALVMRTR